MVARTPRILLLLGLALALGDCQCDVAAQAEFHDPDSTELLQTKNTVKSRRSHSRPNSTGAAHKKEILSTLQLGALMEAASHMGMASLSALGTNGQLETGVPIAVPFFSMSLILALMVIAMYFMSGESESKPQAKGYQRRKPNDKVERGLSRSPMKHPPIRDEDEPEDEPPSDTDAMAGNSQEVLPMSSPALSAREDVQSVRMENLIPPALCPILVMPTCETCFAIALSDLMVLEGSDSVGFNVVGHQGAPLLRVTVRPVSGDNLMSLDVSMIQGYVSAQSPRSEAHSTVIPAMDDKGETTDVEGVFEIWGANRTFYGKLQPASTPGEPSTQLSYDVCGPRGQSLMQISADLDSWTIDVMVGFGAVPLCTVSVSDDTFNGKKHLVFNVPPKVDAVLVLSCVLSMVLLRR